MIMGILISLFRGTAVATIVVFAIALLKALVISLGFLLGIIKFAIVLGFLILIVSIAVSMLRDWSNKSTIKDV